MGRERPEGFREKRIPPASSQWRTRVREYRTRVLLIYGMKWCHGRREKEKRLRSQDMERPI